MPWISRRAQAEQAAAMTRLRTRAETAEQEARVQSAANGRLAAGGEAAQAELANNNRVLLASHRVLREELAVALERVRLLAADRDGLLVQLNRALGYDDHMLADIAAGATVKGGTAA